MATVTCFFRTIILYVAVLAFGPDLRADLSAPQVKTGLGLLEGSVEPGGVRVFRGVPYARPPVGELRWREPQAPEPWTGVRSAKTFAAAPMQPKIWDDIVTRGPEMSEDCLYLNIWTPPFDAGAKDKLHAVLVYFHGGGLAVGDGSELRYDGASMARRGIVMVTINYRLGVFGFFAHPELTKESPHHASGNYGLLDQNAALRWIHANIEAFGGDPDRVTIAGQSAGSMSVCAQMASPLSRGLFSSAIGQSGALFRDRGAKPLPQLERDGLRFAQSLGASSIDELRRMPARQILFAKHQPTFPHVAIDGYFLPKDPLEIYSRGEQADVPLLGGWTTAEVDYHSLLNEDKPTRENFRRVLKQNYGGHADEVAALYLAKNDDDVIRVAGDLAADRFVVQSTWKWLDLHAKSGGKPVYRYLYNQPLPPLRGTKSANDINQAAGAPHSSDIPYALGNLDELKDRAWTEADHETSRILQGYLVNFIKTGNPNGEDLPSWPWLQASIPHVMQIEAEAHAIPEPNLKRYIFLDSLWADGEDAE